MATPLAKPLSILRAAAATATASWAMLGAPAPALAQFIAPGVWVGRPPALIEPDDDMILDDNMIPPRVVGGILRARGYRLVAAPRISGDFVIAIGQDREGRRMRFVIDGYSGGLVRATTLRGGLRERAPAYEARRDFDGDDGSAGPAEGRPLAEPDLDRAPRVHAKPKRHAARREIERRKTHGKPAPSQATRAPEPPNPAAAAAPSGPAAKEEAKAVPETPKAMPHSPSVTPAPSEATKAPAEAQGAKPVEPAPKEAAIAPEGAAKPAAPAPAPSQATEPPATPSPRAGADEAGKDKARKDKADAAKAGAGAPAAHPAEEAKAQPSRDVTTPLAPDAKPAAREAAPEAKPAPRPVETAGQAKSPDIGPQVVPVSPAAKAAETPAHAAAPAGGK